MCWRTCLFVGVAAALAAPVQGDDQDLLRGIVNCRESLLSGKCYITGQVDEGPGYEVRKLDGTIVFDFTTATYRYAEKKRGIFLLNPDFIYSTVDSRAAIHRFPRTKMERFGVCGFDVRTLGFHSEPSMSMIWGLDFAPLRSNLLKSEVLERKDEGSLVRLTVRYPLREGYHYQPVLRIWVNPHKGFTTTRIEEAHVSRPSAVSFFSEMDWKKVNGIWVIDSFHQHSGKFHPRNSVTWKLRWDQVNENIDPALLDVKSLVPPGSEAPLYMLEKPSNKAIQLGVIRNGASPDLDLAEQTVSPRWMTSSGMMFSIGTTLLLISVVIMFMWRRRTRAN